jgi:hypothetical protein
VADVPQGAFFGRGEAVYAAYSVMLAAERLGLGTCHVAYVNVALQPNTGLTHMLGVPDGRRLEAVIIFG